ncbi:hypothetical protein RRG08_049124 [Elysia crispata]|uniref:Uncharacterized protein n=1 Tax=Elysia crispata TaxID=231223 RepID=A0AAE1B5B2_9GAST|nr:hypothetical protein RRG08_049124 [Elysia crispata]
MARKGRGGECTDRGRVRTARKGGRECTDERRVRTARKGGRECTDRGEGSLAKKLPREKIQMRFHKTKVLNVRIAFHANSLTCHYLRCSVFSYTNFVKHSLSQTFAHGAIDRSNYLIETPCNRYRHIDRASPAKLVDAITQHGATLGFLRGQIGAASVLCVSTRGLIARRPRTSHNLELSLADSKTVRRNRDRRYHSNILT